MEIAIRLAARGTIEIANQNQRYDRRRPARVQNEVLHGRKPCGGVRVEMRTGEDKFLIGQAIVELHPTTCPGSPVVRPRFASGHRRGVRQPEQIAGERLESCSAEEAAMRFDVPQPWSATPNGEWRAAPRDRIPLRPVGSWSPRRSGSVHLRMLSARLRRCTHACRPSDSSSYRTLNVMAVKAGRPDTGAFSRLLPPEVVPEFQVCPTAARWWMGRMRRRNPEGTCFDR